jgi:hypothetical protein
MDHVSFLTSYSYSQSFGEVGFEASNNVVFFIGLGGVQVAFARDRWEWFFKILHQRLTGLKAIIWLQYRYSDADELCSKYAIWIGHRGKTAILFSKAAQRPKTTTAPQRSHRQLSARIHAFLYAGEKDLCSQSGRCPY